MFNAIYCENGHYVDVPEDVSERRPSWITAREMDLEIGQTQGDTAHTQFCPECGLKTANRCGECQSPIMYDGKRPSYCRNCGKPFPWTGKQLTAAAELVKEEEGLSEADRVTLTASLPELMADTPRTTLAATRFKRIVGGAGPAFKNAMYKFLVDFSSETAKKIVMGE